MTDQIEQQQEEQVPTGQAIIEVVEHNPALVLLKSAYRDKLIEHIEREVAAFVPDMTTEKGRIACRKFAAEITRTKTTLTETAKGLTEEWRMKTMAVNGERRQIEERLKALAEQARQPLTEWEEAEEKRQADCMAALERLRSAAVVPMGATTDSLRTRIGEVAAESMAEDRWRGMLELGQKAQETALAALKAALERVEQEERDRAELARLRAEREAAEAERLAREAREREEAEAREREKREAAEAAEAEKRKQAEIEESRQREAERAAREEEQRKAAAEQAAREAEARARREEQERFEAAAAEERRLHEEEMAEQRRRADEEQAQRERLESEQREREKQEQAEREARERLEADQAHRRMVKREAKEAIMMAGITEEQAQKVVLLIVAGDVPRCLIDFAAEPKVKPTPRVPEEGTAGGIEQPRPPAAKSVSGQADTERLPL